MFSIHTLMILIPAFPLAAALLTAIIGRSLKENAHWPTVIAIGASFLCALNLLFSVRAEVAAKPADQVGWSTTVDLWNWVDVGSAIARPEFAKPSPIGEGGVVLPDRMPFRIDITLRSDPLTSIMLAMVTFISTLVAIYAGGYMHGERGYWRFFSYISLFVFSMTMLVSVSNFVLLYVFWEAVGVCSYLLIGFWYEKPEAAAAGKKAFLVNRIGDFGFALGLFLIWTTYGTLNFHDAGGIAGVLGQTRLSHPDLYAGGTVATVICLCLMLGACGKSAQFPLHVWLPDAMEGPTPVSALIHAATMVTAGVYMVTRCTPLFIQSPDAQHVVAIIGTITAVLAGVIGLTQNDLKRVLAYSTISQLGYMFLGLGVSTLAGITAGMFHLFTHAFFKALLFLGAGSVMHAMGGVIDMRKFGGLKRLMPTTRWTFLFGCLALAGVFPFAGFWSKDSIIASVHEAAHHAHEHHEHSFNLFQYLYYAALVTSFMTALYTFRAYFMTFHGPEVVPHEAGHHAHESPRNMTVPLMILAVCALGVGAFFAGGEMFSHSAENGFVSFLTATPSLAFKPAQDTGPAGGFHADVAWTSSLVAGFGILGAAILYLGDRRQAHWLAGVLRPFYLLSHGKFFFDQIYDVLFIWPLWLLSQVSYWIDRNVIDGLVNLCGRIPPAIGAMLRSLQTGMVQFYALAMVLGLLVLIGTLLM